MPGTALMVGDTNKNEDQTSSWTKSFTYREDEHLSEREKHVGQA